MKTWPASSGDVVFAGGALHIVTAVAGGVFCIRWDDDRIVWSRDVAEWDRLLFLSAAFDSDRQEIVACGKVQNGAGVGLVAPSRGSVFVPCGPGNYPAALGLRDGRLVLFVVRGQGCADDEVGIYSLDGVLQAKRPITNVSPNTSQGIRFIADDGEIKFGDETIGAPFAGQLASEWMQRAGWTVGQANVEGGGLLVVQPNGRDWFQGLPGLAFFPKLAVDGTRVAVLKIAGELAHVDVFEPPYPATPTTRPPKEEPPVTPTPRTWSPTMPNRLDVLERVKAAFPNEWADMNDPALTGTTRGMAMIRRFVSVLHFGSQRFGVAGDPKFGLLGKRGNPNDVAGDTVTYRNPQIQAGGCEAADIVIEHLSAAARPGWNPDITRDFNDCVHGGTGNCGHRDVDHDASGRCKFGCSECKGFQGGAGAAWVQPERVADDGGSTGGGGGTQPAGSVDAAIDARIAAAVAPLRAALDALKKENAEQRAQIAELIARGSGFPDRIAVGLISERTGKFLCDDGDRPAGHTLHADNRDGLGPWETFTLVRRKD